ncbi:MAG TPA: FAD-dependent oxidoreductase [Candidatus Saccharimonadales bacterium]|nr:FAD-dependent oxidoreductase [Candidatus Saccharimonadales bacterium]
MKLKLIEKRQEKADVITFIFEPTEPLTWQSGQYIHYVLHHEPTDDRGSDRWFTNAAAPFENHVRITTRQSTDKSSSFKKKLFSLVEGKRIEMSVVEGDFVVEDPDQQYVFIAGGIGITPYRSILTQLNHDKKPINVTLLYSNRDQNVVYKEELEEIAKNNPNFKIHYIFSPEHIDEEKIKSIVPDLQKPLFYISGPEPMVDALGETLKKMGVSDDHLKQDWFPGYPAE